MPMAVSPDKRFLIAAVRSKPYQPYSYSIDPGSGALRLVGTGPLAESFPYISLDRGGRFLLGASYGANLVSVNSVGVDGRVGDPLQVIPTARNAHSIRVDNTNRFIFAPHLGTDQVFQFLFDEKSGRLTANSPPILQLKQGTGPRHLIVSADNRFVYVLNELTGTVRSSTPFPCCPPIPSSSPACRAARWARLAGTKPRAIPTMTSGRLIFTSRRIAVFSTPPSGRRARSARSGWMARAEADLPRKHADREAAPRVRHRSHRPLCGRRRREVGHALIVCDRRREWRAQTDRTLSHRQGRELG
jgi:DNA-binding beta-propeller fold protein YncE